MEFFYCETSNFIAAEILNIIYKNNNDKPNF